MVTAEERYEVVKRLCAAPGVNTKSVTLAMLQSIMLHTDGWCRINGCEWGFKYKKLCPGIYSVSMRMMK